MSTVTQEQIPARTITIAKGEYKPNTGEPKIWFTSMKSVKTMLRYGLVDLQRDKTHVRPVVKATGFRIMAAD